MWLHRSSQRSLQKYYAAVVAAFAVAFFRGVQQGFVCRSGPGFGSSQQQVRRRSVTTVLDAPLAAPAPAPRPRPGAGEQHLSKLLGVSWHTGYGRWQASIVTPQSGKERYLGHFPAEKDAGIAYDLAMLALQDRLGGSRNEVATNFPAKRYTQDEIDDAGRQLKGFWLPQPSAEMYYGVYQTMASRQWKAEVEMLGRWTFQGMYDDAEEAALAVDEAIRQSPMPRKYKLMRLNFKSPQDYFLEETWQEEETMHDDSSCFLGVSYHQPSDMWLAKRGRRNIGLFSTQLEAARAFDEVSGSTGGPTNFAPRGL